MPYEKLAATLVTYAIIGCILLLTIGAILCFPRPPATSAGAPALRPAAWLGPARFLRAGHPRSLRFMPIVVQAFVALQRRAA